MPPWKRATPELRWECPSRDEMAKIDYRFSPMPGIIVAITGKPTPLDPEGMDGLYVEAVIVIDLARFNLFLNWNGEYFPSFSIN